DQLSPSVAFDGTNYLVVWQDFRSLATYDIYGARVSTGGQLLDPFGIDISLAANDQVSPAIAFDGTRYLVVWSDFRGGANYQIYGTMVQPDGTVTNPNGIGIATALNNQTNPGIVAGGGLSLVVWQRSGPSWDIYGARVDGAGTVLDPTGIAI